MASGRTCTQIMYRPTALPRRSRPPRRPSVRGPVAAAGASRRRGHHRCCVARRPRTVPGASTAAGCAPGCDRRTGCPHGRHRHRLPCHAIRCRHRWPDRPRPRSGGASRPGVADLGSLRDRTRRYGGVADHRARRRTGRRAAGFGAAPVGRGRPVRAVRPIGPVRPVDAGRGGRAGGGRRGHGRRSCSRAARRPSPFSSPARLAADGERPRPPRDPRRRRLAGLVPFPSPVVPATASVAAPAVPSACRAPSPDGGEPPGSDRDP